MELLKMVVLVGVFTMALSSEGVQKWCLAFTAAQRKCTVCWSRCVETHWIEGNCGTQQHVLLLTRHYTFVFLVSLIAAVLCFLLRFCNSCNVAAIKEKCSAWYICMVNKHLVWKDMITTYFTTLFLLLKNKILIASNINNVSATTHLWYYIRVEAASEYDNYFHTEKPRGK